MYVIIHRHALGSNFSNAQLVERGGSRRVKLLPCGWGWSIARGMEVTWCSVPDALCHRGVLYLLLGSQASPEGRADYGFPALLLQHIKSYMCDVALPWL